MFHEIQKLLDPLRRKLLMILARGLVTSSDDDKGLQQIQISLLKDELIDKIDRYQNYGFTSHPQSGAQAIGIFNGGNRSNGVVICVDDRRYRLKSLKQGEVAIYTDEEDYIHFKRDNTIEVKTKNFIVNSEKVEITATQSLKIETPDSLIKTNKLRITNGSNEVISVLVDWMTNIISATTNTMLGPMKLLGASFPSIKTKLEAFRK